MNKEAMKQQILEAVSKRLENGFHVSIQRVYKANHELDGLVIMAEDENTAPTIYLEPFYEALANGVSTDDVCSRLLHEIYLARLQTHHFDTGFLLDFHYVKDRLYVQLINRHLNQNLLQNVPHTLFLDDFAIVIRCRVDTSEDCNASFLIHNRLLKMWQTDHETALSLALHNTRKLLGVELIPMEELIRELAPEALTEPVAQNPLWIMTAKDKSFGAVTVLFDDVLKDFAEKHGSFYVIFSSIHEVLLIPSPDSSDIDTFTRHNRNVNAASLEKDEILGTRAYFYEKDKGFVL